jgi:hypothetical protein
MTDEGAPKRQGECGCETATYIVNDITEHLIGTLVPSALFGVA